MVCKGARFEAKFTALLAKLNQQSSSNTISFPMAPLLRPRRGFRVPAGEVEALPGLNRMFPGCKALAALCLQDGLAANGSR